MKRLALSIAAMLLAAGPLAASPAQARDHGERGERGDRGERGGWERQERGPAPGWARREGGERPVPPGWGRDGRGWERIPAPPPGYYGPPPGAYGPRSYGVRRGGYLPPEVRGGVVGDYPRYHLRAPPRGYTWMRVGNAFLLMNMATGQIFDVIED